jgi:hypothetical protein
MAEKKELAWYPPVWHYQFSTIHSQLPHLVFFHFLLNSRREEPGPD